MPGYPSCCPAVEELEDCECAHCTGNICCLLISFAGIAGNGCPQADCLNRSYRVPIKYDGGSPPLPLGCQYRLDSSFKSFCGVQAINATWSSGKLTVNMEVENVRYPGFPTFHVWEKQFEETPTCQGPHTLTNISQGGGDFNTASSTATVLGLPGIEGDSPECENEPRNCNACLCEDAPTSIVVEVAGIGNRFCNEPGACTHANGIFALIQDAYWKCEYTYSFGLPEGECGVSGLEIHLHGDVYGHICQWAFDPGAGFWWAPYARFRRNGPAAPYDCRALSGPLTLVAAGENWPANCNYNGSMTIL